ncbi:recombinase RecT, partial [Leptospira interrogans]|uniref:recombinase RecT n=1 Tax=Leptospira interrogans TaxID=173 RepID=UPI001D15328C
NVLNKVRVLESQGNLELPNDYSPSNAMKQAWLQISQDNKLMSCNDTSKANALLDMVTQGLNPAKNQCYFIPYGNKMQLQRSYHGNVMMLKRDAGAQDVVAHALLTLSLRTLNKPKTCRMVGLIAHAMPTFVCKFS